MSGLPADTRESSSTIDSIYRALERNEGREQVSDANVDALIERAERAGNAQLELLLREWRSPCGDDPDAPVLPPGLPPPAPTAPSER